MPDVHRVCGSFTLVLVVGCGDPGGPRAVEPGGPDRRADSDDDGEAAPESEALEADEAPPSPVPFDTKEHGTAAHDAVGRASCGQYLSRNLGLLNHQDGNNFLPSYAFAWGNDPDCKNDDCNGKTYETIHESDGSYCWACRNMDHFVENPAWNPTSTPADPLTGTSRTSHFKDNPDALNRLSQRAFELAQQAAQTGDAALARQAARAALRGCHYLTDQLACGHKTGNKACDPGADTLTEGCRAWVDTNREALSFANERIVDAALKTCNGEGGWLGAVPKCHDQLASGGWYSPETEGRRAALRYAAAERLVRHYSAGATLRETDGSSWKNDCHPDCSNGECLACGDASCPCTGSTPTRGTCGYEKLVNACRELLDATVCAALPKNKVAVNTSCACGTTGGEGGDEDGGESFGCEVIGECRDALPGETGHGSCDEALAAEPIACCGDGVCSEPGGETPVSCPDDCDGCGNGTCEPAWGEDCSSCASDCGCADPYECEAGTCVCTEVLIPPAQCGATICRDYGPCPDGQLCVDNQCETVQRCGNYRVEPGEECESGYDCAIGHDCVECRCEESECASRCGDDRCECDEERFCFADCYHGGGGGSGGGDGGGGRCTCDCDRDGEVSEQECADGCGGAVEDGFCVVGLES